jgi:energy-coupling factor transporter ATP-binding protein EcfA2
MNYCLEIDSFGCLESLNVDLSTGLNYVYGEHGSGKSTFLRALQTTLFGKAFGGKHKQMGKAGFHQISLQNHVFDVTQGYNERDGKFFRGEINGQKLEGEYAENREKFLRYFDVTPKTAWDVLTNRTLFYYHTPTLWSKTDTEMVSYLTKVLGQDVQRTQTAHDKIKKETKVLKDQITELEKESKKLVWSGVSFNRRVWPKDCRT